MLLLDFINVGNGDSTLIRQVENGQLVFSMLVDCGHDNLIRDDHPLLNDDRSCRIYAGDFLNKLGIEHLDVLLLTHFHRDHVGGMSRLLDCVTVGELIATYIPPEDSYELEPEKTPGLCKAAINQLRCLDRYARALRTHPGRVAKLTELSGRRTESLQLTPELKMDILCGEPALYSRQKDLYNGAFAGIRDDYDLVRWGKSMNASSLRQRLYYHGKEIVLGGDVYAHLWETSTSTPCDILKVPHHASLSSTTRKLLKMLRPKTAVVCVAAGRPDERPHPYIISLIREYTEDLHFTDSVNIPGLVEPVYHESVHLEVE